MEKGKGKSAVIEEEIVGSSRGREAGDVASSSSRGGGGASSSSRGGGAMLWSRELDRHFFGYVSTAVMKANRNLEDYSQVELGRKSTFVGVYDGHSGHEAAAHVRGNLTEHLMRRIRHTSTMSIDHLREAFLRTEASWLDKVDALFESDPYIAGYGTCCLVGVLWRRNLYLANVGDSRAIMGRTLEGSNEIDVQQLTRDDNVRYPEVREEVQALHPDEPNFIVEEANNEGVFRIKGRIQVSKSIGDAYLKRARFNLNHVDKRFELNTPVSDDSPALSADPLTYTIPIEPQDRFVIFASGGLWDLMTNQEAANIVHNYPKEGIAERLITEGLTILEADRRRIHDNISVVVIFFDHTLQGTAGQIHEDFPKHSISVSTEGETNFTALDELNDLDELAHILARLVYINNLPCGTNFLTLYPLLPGPAVEAFEFGRHGCTCRVLFYEVAQAVRFMRLHRDAFILSGKLCCVSYIWEHDYRRTFRGVDIMYSRLEVPYTVHVSGLAADVTVECLAWFFIGRGLQLRNFPIMHVTHNGEMYAFVSFTSVADRDTALRLLNGLELLGSPIRIRRSQNPQF